MSCPSDLLYRIPSGMFAEDLLKVSLKHLFLALDFLHTECGVVHTGMTRNHQFGEIVANLSHRHQRG